MIGALLRLYPGMRVIVAGDGSTYGTRELVAELAERNPAVRLLDRSSASEHGLTASVLDAVLFDLLKCLPRSTRITDVPYEFGMHEDAPR